uniref:Uncharacterized protein n=1 Tax=Anopheles farauti TaxID=69004 RepID=A0A182R0G0_9DIPT
MPSPTTDVPFTTTTTTTVLVTTTKRTTPTIPWDTSSNTPSVSTEITYTPPSEPTTLPIITQPNEPIALWIALSGVFIVLFIIASAMALYIYVAGVELGQLVACGRKTNRSAARPEAPAPGALQTEPNNFDPFDAYYNKQLQQQLKNRLRPKHNSVSSISNNSSKAIRQKYSKFNLNPYGHPAPMGGKATPLEQPRFDLMDDIDVIKYKNRLNEL